MYSVFEIKSLNLKLDMDELWLKVNSVYENKNDVWFYLVFSLERFWIVSFYPQER